MSRQSWLKCTRNGKFKVADGHWIPIQFQTQVFIMFQVRLWLVRTTAAPQTYRTEVAIENPAVNNNESQSGSAAHF